MQECRLQYAQVAERERSVLEQGYLSKSLETLMGTLQGPGPRTESNHEPLTQLMPLWRGQNHVSERVALSQCTQLRLRGT